jgi:hypothetical protein
MKAVYISLMHRQGHFLFQEKRKRVLSTVVSFTCAANHVSTGRTQGEASGLKILCLIFVWNSNLSERFDAETVNIIHSSFYSWDVVYLYYRVQRKESPPYISALSAIRKSSFASSISWPTIFPLPVQGIHCEGCSSPCYHQVPETKLYVSLVVVGADRSESLIRNRLQDNDKEIFSGDLLKLPNHALISALALHVYIKLVRGKEWRTMLQNSTASPLFGLTHSPLSIVPPQLHSPSPA